MVMNKLQVFLIFNIMLTLSCINEKVEKSNYLCIAFNEVIKTPIFSKQFLNEQSEKSIITIIDTSGRLTNCNLSFVKEVPVKTNSHLMGKSIMLSDPNILMISDGSKSPEDYSISLWCPSSGSALIVNYLINDKKELELMGYRIGDY